jgi:hypothetical protein
VEVTCGGVLGVGVTLGDQKEHRSFVPRRVDRRKGARAADEERHGDERKDDDVAERQNR